MQIITDKSNSSYHLWAPLALLGPDLAPRANILLGIKKGRIESRQTVLKDYLPSSVINHPGFICLEQDHVLLPALIDAHVHMALGAENFSQLQRAVPVEQLPKTPCFAERCKAYLQAGICCVRDGGDFREINLSYKSMLSNGGCCGPRIVATGSALRRDNAYGSFLGSGYASVQEIPAAVKRLYSAGVDQLKVIISGVVSFDRYSRVNGPLLMPEDLHIVVSQAKKYGLKVMAHASSALAVDLAVRAGVDSIEHGYYIQWENMQLMAEKKIAWVPTVIPVAAQVRGSQLKERTIEQVNLITRIYEEQVEKLKWADSLGIALGVGTDAGATGVGHGVSLVEELLLYREGALSNRSILKSATAVNAAIVGLERDVGSVEIGRKANLIVVRGNPLDDLTVLKDIVMHLRSA